MNSESFQPHSTAGKQERNERRKHLFLLGTMILAAVFYEIFILFFLVVELRALGDMRVTNQVLLLLGLVFLPVGLLAIATMVRSLRFSVQGQEFEVKFDELEGRVETGFKALGDDIVERLGDSQQALTTILAGDDPDAEKRIEDRRLIIGSKGFRSSGLMAHVLAHAISRHGEIEPPVTAEVKWPNGSTLQNFAELQKGFIDLYVEYTATGCQIFGDDCREWSTSQTIDHLNRKTESNLGIRWLAPLGVVDDYRLVVRAEDARERRLDAISDLVRNRSCEEMIIGSGGEFFSRSDGFAGLKQHYGLRFRGAELCAYEEGYQRLAEGQIDVYVGWDSDAALDNRDRFIPLKDDRNYFPAYAAVPVVRTRILEAFPEIDSLFRDRLRDSMSTGNLRLRVDAIQVRGDDPAIFRDEAARIADEILSKKRLVKAVPAGGGEA